MTTSKPACHEHEDHDGCLCHAPVSEHEATQDHDLPEATGGVEGDLKAKRRRKTDRAAPTSDD